MKRQFTGGGLAVWSLRHPVGVVMIALAIVVLGAFSLGRLGVDLLPQLIYPDVRVRILDPGMPAVVVEDQITRQLEEQLAITEDAVRVQSNTREGRSAVDLSFAYGKDIDLALRDASSRLDRAKRFLPDTIEPPTIYKRDPSQIPIFEMVVASALRDPVQLRSWVDYVFSKWFVNLPGVAAVEVGGGLEREIHVLADPQKLSARGMDIRDIAEALRENNTDSSIGRLELSQTQIGGRSIGRLQSIEDIGGIPLPQRDGMSDTTPVRISAVAEIVDSHVDEKLRIRLDGAAGIKVSIQKQPSANTVTVVDTVKQRLDELTGQATIPGDISVSAVSDQSVFVRAALRNATNAAITGALLAMLVVYLFLGDFRRTLIIGSAIPIAVMVTFLLMGFGGLTLNIMTLGGLALGIGLLVDNTIVMLENISRHQRAGEEPFTASTHAAGEVNSAIVAATMTNLAAVLPFLFVGGLVGLLFRELIFTISAAIVSSMIVALTLVPALAGKIRPAQAGDKGWWMDGTMKWLQAHYSSLISSSLRAPWLVIITFVAGLGLSVPALMSAGEGFLPAVDQGQIRVSITADSGINLDLMDGIAAQIEDVISERSEVESVFSQIGGFVFGRSEYESTNRSSLLVQLVPHTARSLSSEQWMDEVKKEIRALKLPGVRVRMWPQGIRGVRLGHGDDDISLRVQGPELDELARIGDAMVNRLRSIEGLRNLKHSLEDQRQELAVIIDRERAAQLGVTAREIGEAIQSSVQGTVVTDFVDGNQSIDIRLRLLRESVSQPSDLESIAMITDRGDVLRVSEVAHVELVSTPNSILRDQQQRIVEVSASLDKEVALSAILDSIEVQLADFELPARYSLYDGGTAENLRNSQTLGMVLLALAVFLVFVVMAVQYESLRNPKVILLSVPFSIIGVATGIWATDMPISVPVWLGMIMLAGIVVNNAIVLVEYIEIRRNDGLSIHDAIVSAAKVRLRPILMTTLTTVAGLLPLAIALGEGAEMLQPLAITIVYGLSFSLLVSLVLIPSTYRVVNRG